MSGKLPSDSTAEMGPRIESGRSPDSSEDPIRKAIEEQHDEVLRSIVVLVSTSEKYLRWSEVLETASEILQESVREALAHAEKFDPSRSASAWIRGIAAKLLLSRRRQHARDRRCVSATTLGSEGWIAAIDELCTSSSVTHVERSVDLQVALGKLSLEQRRVIELRYYQGLDGDDLAIALNVATAGAARVRVCRALQELRTIFVSNERVVP
jgi:RNA polymerase sigma factor (sigma-70 family)